MIFFSCVMSSPFKGLNFVNLNLDNYNENSNRNNKAINYNTINNNANVYYTGNKINNRPIIKINNNYKSTNNFQENKNKSNYNFHDILQVNNTRKNNRSLVISSSENNEIINNKNNEGSAKLPRQATLPIKSSDKKSSFTLQKNSFNYKSNNNKGYNTNYNNVNEKNYADNIWGITPIEVPEPTITKEGHFVSTSNLSIHE